MKIISYQSWLAMIMLLFFVSLAPQVRAAIPGDPDRPIAWHRCPACPFSEPIYRDQNVEATIAATQPPTPAERAAIARGEIRIPTEVYSPPVRAEWEN